MPVTGQGGGRTGQVQGVLSSLQPVGGCLLHQPGGLKMAGQPGGIALNLFHLAGIQRLQCLAHGSMAPAALGRVHLFVQISLEQYMPETVQR